MVLDTDREINIDGPMCAGMRSQLNRALRQTINQLMRGAEDATVTLKIDMSLYRYSKRTGDNLQNEREAIVPEIAYKVTAVTRSRDEGGDKVTDKNDELIVDRMRNRFYIVPTEEADGQTSIFDGEDDTNDRDVAD